MTEEEKHITDMTVMFILDGETDEERCNRFGYSINLYASSLDRGFPDLAPEVAEANRASFAHAVAARISEIINAGGLHGGNA